MAGTRTQEAADQGAPPHAPGGPEGAGATAAPTRGVVARVRRYLISGHAGPLLALAALHFLAFSRSLVRHDGGIHVIPWDFDVSYHRFVLYVSDCLRSGELPLWNPFNAAGTPFFINPQAQAWSPVTLLLSALVGYTHGLAQRQLVFTLLLGGVGAYGLGYALWRSRAAALVSGLCFGLTAAVYTNMQHMDIVNAAGLLPWLFWAATRAAGGSRLALPAMAFLLYWFVTSGYPGVVAMSLLWIVAYWVHLSITTRAGLGARLRFIASGAGAALAGAGLAAVHWVPIAVHSRELARGGTLSIEQALHGHGSLSFVHLWGFLLSPVATVLPEGTRTDMSMGGLYFGVVALPLVGAALLHGPARPVRLLAATAAGALLLATGGESFVRYAIHLLVPAFNFSRFAAADSRSLAVLALALLAGGGAALLARGDVPAREAATRGCRWLLLALPAGALVLRFLAYPGMPAGEFTQRILAPVTAQLALVLWSLVVLQRPLAPRATVAGLALALAVDLGSAVAVNYYPVGHPVSGAHLAERHAQHRRDFDALSPDKPRLAPEANAVAPQGLTAKEFFVSDYGGFRLTRYVSLIDRGFGGWLERGPRAAALPPDASPEAFADFERLLRPADFRITRYGPNGVDYEVDTPGETLLVLNEVFFPGWRATVDGAATPVVEVAGGLRAVRVGAGQHAIRTEFRPPIFFLSAAVSALSALAVLAWAAFLVWSDWRSRQAAPLLEEDSECPLR